MPRFSYFLQVDADDEAVVAAWLEQGLSANPDLSVIASLSAPDEQELILCNWTCDDVRGLAEELGVAEALALQRAQAWARHIADFASAVIAQQLRAVVVYGCP